MKKERELEKRGKKKRGKKLPQEDKEVGSDEEEEEVMKPVKPSPTRPPAASKPAPKPPRATKPSTQPVAGSSKGKISAKSPAVVPSSADEAEPEAKMKGKGKVVYRATPISISSGEQSVPLYKGKGKFRGKFSQPQMNLRTDVWGSSSD
jgi:hypothetical protein